MRLHPEKTGIVCLTGGGQGFDFLGFHHRKMEFATLALGQGDAGAAGQSPCGDRSPFAGRVAGELFAARQVFARCPLPVDLLDLGPFHDAGGWGACSPSCTTGFAAWSVRTPAGIRSRPPQSSTRSRRGPRRPSRAPCPDGTAGRRWAGASGTSCGLPGTAAGRDGHCDRCCPAYRHAVRSSGRVSAVRSPGWPRPALARCLAPSLYRPDADT